MDNYVEQQLDNHFVITTTTSHNKNDLIHLNHKLGLIRKENLLNDIPVLFYFIAIKLHFSYENILIDNGIKKFK